MQTDLVEVTIWALELYYVRHHSIYFVKLMELNFKIHRNISKKGIFYVFSNNNVYMYQSRERYENGSFKKNILKYSFHSNYLLKMLNVLKLYKHQLISL